MSSLSTWARGRQKAGRITAAVVLSLFAAAINLPPAKTRPLPALGQPGVLADVRFAPGAANQVGVIRRHSIP